ncbi:MULTISPECIES: hypothetical protein [Streptomyces]|uniref:hypothetical protein n=1 Tax=Streptomyces TaxID=1883 RepID=UPI0006F53DC7|nr:MULTISPECIES: hypothetical protein [unclassified Streptomyces]KQZ12121.1 hypothetical protein ASD51_33720 [Streptomyces sp. Root55]
MTIYGSEPDEPSGVLPGHRYATLVDGPLDGQLIDVTDWSVQQLLDGAALCLELRGIEGTSALASPALKSVGG